MNTDRVYLSLVNSSFLASMSDFLAKPSKSRQITPEWLTSAESSLRVNSPEKQMAGSSFLTRLRLSLSFSSLILFTMSFDFPSLMRWIMYSTDL